MGVALVLCAAETEMNDNATAIAHPQARVEGSLTKVVVHNEMPLRNLMRLTRPQHGSYT